MTVAELDTPAVLIDTDVMRRNLSRMADYCRAHRLNLRPHTKTHKIPELARLQVEYGATGITVAKLGEAEVMAEAGLDDIVIVYPVFGEGKWERLLKLAGRIRIAVAVDSEEIAREISKRAAARGVTVGIRAEFDTGFGRCGMPISRDSVEAAARMSELAGLRWDGISIYPGHIAATRAERGALIEHENEVLGGLLELLARRGVPVPVVSGGNTPAAFLWDSSMGLTEIRPGTYIFNDRNTVCAESVEYADCAATVLATVVSTSVPGRAIVDAGSKTLSSDRLHAAGGTGYGHVLGHPGIAIEGLSEEHGHLALGGGATLRVGDRLRIVPNHVCTCMNLHDRVWAVRGDSAIGEWRVAARGQVR
jgi:D-serine deaminase-like pyridoxal phosphate-dependent protein